jgi:hypothetical protein
VRLAGGLELEDCGERRGREPGGREDVGAALAFEEEGEPEGEGGALGGNEGGGAALGVRWLAGCFIDSRKMSKM